MQIATVDAETKIYIYDYPVLTPSGQITYERGQFITMQATLPTTHELSI